MSRELGVGLVGLGEVAQTIHLPVLQSMADRYRVTAVSDVSREVTEYVAGRFAIPSRFEDSSALIADPAVDVVFVLASNPYHAELAIEAANSGKHVFVEKPMCISEREAEAIIRARDKAGVVVMVGYMRRFAPAFVRAKELVAGMGEITHAHVRDIIGRNSFFVEQTAVVKRATDTSPDMQEQTMRRQAALIQEAIGRVPADIASAYSLLLGLGSHDLSAMRELLGYPKRVLSCRQWRGGRFVTALFDYDGYGAVFEMGVDDERRFDAYLEVGGLTSTVRVRYNTPYIRHLPTMLEVSSSLGGAWTSSQDRLTFTDPFTVELEHLHECITEGAPLKTTPEDFVQDLRLFQQMVNAMVVAANGRPGARA